MTGAASVMEPCISFCIPSPEKMEERMQGSTDYTLAEFGETYNLKPDQAERIFNLSGPTKVKLDVFMKVYKKPKAAEKLFIASDR